MITSTSNAKIKRLNNIRKKHKTRKEEGVFLTEGLRMFEEVPDLQLKELYVTERFLDKNRKLVDEKRKASGCGFEILSESVMESVSDTKTPQGVLCVVSADRKASQEKPQTPLVLILEDLQDPGNLGTILRTAEAAGITEVLMSRNTVDVYNPKVIRSTMGSIFRVPFSYVDDLAETVGILKDRGIKVYAAHLGGKKNYEEADLRSPAAFMIGNEGNGLKDETAALADEYILIPMAGKVESLNASAAAAVLMFEAARQRRS